jgi:hypothetical protein
LHWIYFIMRSHMHLSQTICGWTAGARLLTPWCVQASSSLAASAAQHAFNVADAAIALPHASQLPCLLYMSLCTRLQESPFFTADVPPDVLVKVLRQLPQSQRLCECSLVCRAWRAAATAATDELQMLPNRTGPAFQR